MSLEGALAGARAAAEAIMRDTVRIEHQTGTTVDPGTLEEVPTYATVYESKARVQRPGTQPSETVAGEIEFGVSTVLVQLPLTVAGVKRDHRVTVTALGAESDPDMLGLVATVKANLTKSHATKRTLVCEEVT